MVLFNRFYQPDFDLENLEVVPNLLLSTAHELPLRLNWVAIMFEHIRADLAITARRSPFSAPARRVNSQQPTAEGWLRLFPHLRPTTY